MKKSGDQKAWVWLPAFDRGVDAIFTSRLKGELIQLEQA
jgi:hypothetical protein